MRERHKTRDAIAREFSKQVREARGEAGLTQWEVAERMGIATEVYGRMERGLLLPSLPMLLRLCGVLMVDANGLLGLSGKRAPEWLVKPVVLESEPPAIRRLVRTARQLQPRQLRALGTVANAMLPSLEEGQGRDPGHPTG
ncbi:MAG TPA: helix-turn-helix domain-containing protein [Archangium sp.]|uniref:helix-turn-helix transcriptional regulator n=1 Tax=Archangium sp. TaxID=1872627 RepID=UPI002E3108A2|nr:helix-turn-helix domain-containing protein [Archangium sp.]HEX5749204.1 helix-turn-helix domain-containing protein [Archangium sp.]